MSEYQFVAFRAIDRPVNGKNLEYMRKQSSRAEITPLSFENEYHYGDFHGNAVEMLRRGYDIHLHYASFGTRRVLIRLPNGLPDPKALRSYVAEGTLGFIKDKKGSGGILCIEPCQEPGDLEDLLDIDPMLDSLEILRTEILDGDLRPLYLAHLAVACDDEHDPEETNEAPVPAGLDALSGAQRDLAELYGLSEALIAAAAQESPPMRARGKSAAGYDPWVRAQSEETKNKWLIAVLKDPDVSIRPQMLAKYRADQAIPSWPTATPGRTIAQLRTAAEEVACEMQRRAADRAARERVKRLAKMAADPTAVLREADRLVAERSSYAYKKVGELLADLRETLSGSSRSNLAEEHAEKLSVSNPTRRILISELRRQGLVRKPGK